MSEVHDFLQELPEELSPNNWPSEAFKGGFVYICAYCSVIHCDPTDHLTHSPSCMEALAEANGKWEAGHGVAK